MGKKEEKDLFKEMRDKVLAMDPVYWAENNLTLDGDNFSLHGGGYKPFADIYRYCGIKLLEEKSKPVVVVSGRQVGKTTMAAILECYYCACGLYGGEKSPARILHAFPTLEMAAGYTKTKLQPIISGAKPSGIIKGGKSKSILEVALDTSQDTNNSLQFKQFHGGNQIFIESTGKEGDRIRGKTADMVFFDEVQDMLREAINNTTKILTASKYGPKGQGVQVYLGTPKKKGSNYHNIWLNSNQQYYYLGCSNCNEFFPLYTPNSNEWEKIWVREKIVKCTHCGHEQDKNVAAENGKWIATITDENEYKYIGYHINQFYIPFFTKEFILSQRPENNVNATERSFNNEVLGEFYHGENSPLDLQEIVDACGDKDRAFTSSIKPSDGKMVVMGIDFGLKNDMEQLAEKTKTNSLGSSYTTAVIMSVENNQLYKLEFACKFPKNDLQYKKDFIAELMQRFSVNLCVGDIGFAQEVSEELYKIHGDKYMVSRAGGMINNNIRVLDHFPKEIQFAKDYFYSEIINKLKTGHVRMPIKSYDSISWLLQHCTNMELKVSINRSNDPKATYVKSGINDGFTALLNAYLAGRYLLTHGFKELDPKKLDNQFSKLKESSVILGHVPKML